MKALRVFAFLVVLPVSVQIARAEEGGTVFSQPSILQIAHELQEEVKDPTKAPDGIVERSLDDSVRIAVRNRSGRGELHVHADDIFFAISGTATLITGGSIVNPKGDVEVRGDSVRGGKSAPLRPGDVVHIPHATPHQMLIKPGQCFVYVVVKIPRTN
jgi:mannose-6-phosphate isomerase-like protein (cupin superfamily)